MLGSFCLQKQNGYTTMLGFGRAWALLEFFSLELAFNIYHCSEFKQRRKSDPSDRKCLSYKCGLDATSARKSSPISTSRFWTDKTFEEDFDEREEKKLILMQWQSGGKEKFGQDLIA